MNKKWRNKGAPGCLLEASLVLRSKALWEHAVLSCYWLIAFMHGCGFDHFEPISKMPVLLWQTLETSLCLSFDERRQLQLLQQSLCCECNSEITCLYVVACFALITFRWRFRKFNHWSTPFKFFQLIRCFQRSWKSIALMAENCGRWMNGTHSWVYSTLCF